MSEFTRIPCEISGALFNPCHIHPRNPGNPPSPFGEIQASPYTSERFERPPLGARHQRPRNRPPRGQGPGTRDASGLPSGSNKHSWLENPPCSNRKYIFKLVDFPASYVRLPECIGFGVKKNVKHHVDGPGACSWVR